MSTEGISRRQALAGAATVGIGLPLLAACGSGSAANGSGSGSGSNPGSGGSASGSLGPASAVPVGGGTIFSDQRVVVTQPNQGDFKCFSAICTHAGCPVSNVDGGTINCNCHGSKFSIDDGSVVSGPAPSPLGEVGVSVKRGKIILA